MRQKEKKKMGKIELSAIENHLGEFETFQAFVLAIVCFSNIIAALHMLANVFLLGIPKHRCYIPSCDTNSTSFAESFVSFAIPNGTDSSCRRFARLPGTPFCSEESFTNDRTVSCTNFVWEDDEFDSTVVSEFNLVCHNQGRQVASSSVFMAGVLIGAVVFGTLADKFGRKTTLIAASFVLSVASLMTALMPSIELFTIAHFITAAASIGLGQISFILIIEFIGSRRRLFYLNVLMVMFPVGELVLALAAYYVRRWRVLETILGIPCVFLFAFCWMLPESAMWLISKGQHSKAKKIILRAAKWNKVVVPEYLLKIKENKTIDEEKKMLECGPLDLIRTPRLRKWSINLFFCWFVNSMVYYGLSLSAGQLIGDIYTNFALMAIAEIPSTLLGLWALKHFGRRWVLCCTMVFGGAACGLTTFLPVSFAWLITTLAVLGKSAISSSFNVIYIYSCEIYPTVLRSTGLGFCSMFARVGGILAPIISSLNTVFLSLPMVIFGAVSILSGLLALALPETHNKKLPETIDEAESFQLLSKVTFDAKFPNLLKKQLDEEEEALISSDA